MSRQTKSEFLGMGLPRWTRKCEVSTLPMLPVIFLKQNFCCATPSVTVMLCLLMTLVIKSTLLVAWEPFILWFLSSSEVILPDVPPWYSTFPHESCNTIPSLDSAFGHAVSCGWNVFPHVLPRISCIFCAWSSLHVPLPCFFNTLSSSAWHFS